MLFTLENVSLLIVIAYSLCSWLILTGIKLNYGRLINSPLKAFLSPKLGWCIFQTPNLLWAVYFLMIQKHSISLAYSLFIIHYVNRTIIYPLRLATVTQIPLEIMVSAFVFTSANGFLQGMVNYQATRQAESMPLIVLIPGVTLFAIGMTMNIYSDNILQITKGKLAKEGSNKYVRIDAFLFRYISNPNYLGEVIEWLGYAIVSGHPYACLFLFSTLNILIPAAIVRNKWNKQNIPGYPSNRKSIFPFIL